MRSTAPPEGERRLGLPRVVMVLVALAALTTLVLEYGFRLDERSIELIEVLDWGLAALFGVDLALRLVMAHGGERRAVLRTRWHEFALLGLFGLSLAALALLGTEENLAELLGMVHVRSVAKLLLALVQVFLLLTLVLRALQAQERYLSSKVPAEYLFMGSFALLITLGTLLLLLPGSRAEGAAPITFLDALFTSTSASCVTGLAVRDTGAEFSLLGQVVILFLFQVGGLGIITFVAFGSVLATKSFSVPQTVALRDLTNSSTLREARRFVWHVVLWMLLVEGVGALLLYFSLPAGSGPGLWRGYWCVFHAVSAFCNAGFSLQGDSLVQLDDAVGVNLVLMVLIVLGGLGMPVTRELVLHRITRAPFFRRFRFFQRLHQGKAHKRLSLQTRLSLWMTGGLLLVGFVGFWALERHGVLAGRPPGEAALASAFQAVTPRTAGFNTVPFEDLTDATLVLVIGLMAIGAGPLSTGGGIKTVTFAVLLVALRAMATGRPGVEVAGRSLSRVLVRGALSVFVLYVAAAGTFVFVLSITDPHVAFRDRIFEVVSALSTVGLSTGVTTQFGGAGRVVLCVAMFMGRVGPLALILSVFRSRRSGENYQYPEEELVVG
ncbi:MAG: Trk family potassium uptake protein [Planctomycetes bacterium]|nr:Trk family potassium uptake protein [Planctomycetota bacterium]